MTSRPPRQLNPGFSLAPSPSLRGGLIIVLSLVSVIFPARVEATGHWKPAEAAAQRLLEMEDKCVSQDKTDNINANAGDTKPAPVTTVYHSDKTGGAKGEADNRRVKIRTTRLGLLWLGWTFLLAVLLARAILRIWHGNKREKPMFDFEKPWMAIEEKTRVSFEKELQKELGEEHLLYQKAVRAIARREDGDDVLFLLDPQTTECAVVHLTWQGCRDFDEKWPMAEIFMSLDEFKVKRMLPDHDEFCD